MQNILFENFPLTDIKANYDPIPIPYLDNPPDIISIDIGRQLFVDDFLISFSNMNRKYHSALVDEISPILTPTTDIEKNNDLCPMAGPFNDGLWYDESENLYKMWYQAGWFDGTALATSKDGLEWERPELDVVKGTNLVLPKKYGYHFGKISKSIENIPNQQTINNYISSKHGFNRRDGALVWLDPLASSDERYKMFIFFRWYDKTVWPEGETGQLFFSKDGIHWHFQGNSSQCGDNTNFFYNPFREKFVFSIRENWPYRARAYYENKDFIKSANWKVGEQVHWYRTDVMDLPDLSIGDIPQLYDLNAVAYESIMLGMIGIFFGPQNNICTRTGMPKIIDLQLGFSRDGFHWHRPNRKAFIASSRKDGTWNYGYIHATGGLCVVLEDELRFYFSAFSGKGSTLPPGKTHSFQQENAMYAGASTGLAKIRRDGFASLFADHEPCELITRMLTFRGKFLFVNVDTSLGQLRIELLNHNNEKIKTFSLNECIPIKRNSTKIMVKWSNTCDLSSINHKPVSIRFVLTRGAIYSFWISPDKSGTSQGYLAAGGPSSHLLRDIKQNN